MKNKTEGFPYQESLNLAIVQTTTRMAKLLKCKSVYTSIFVFNAIQARQFVFSLLFMCHMLLPSQMSDDDYQHI